MAFTNPGTNSLLTDSPYLRSDLTDWLHLSPCSQSPLQDVSLSARANFAALDSPDLRAYSTGIQMPPRETDASLPKALTGEPNAALPVLSYTPSPTLVGIDLPENSDASFQIPPPVPLTVYCSPISSSQEIFNIKPSPLASLFYFGREPASSFESDASPVIRERQEHAAPRSKETRKKSRQKLKFALEKQSRSLVFDASLASTPHTAFPSSSVVSGSILLSPCKLNNSRETPSTTSTGPRTSPMHQDSHRQLLPPPARTNDAASLPPISLRSLSGPDSPLIMNSSKRPRQDDVASAPPHKRRHLGNTDEADEAGTPQISARAEVSAGPVFTSRILPSSVEVSQSFPLFYRRFPASAYFSASDPASPCTLFNITHPGGTWNRPRNALDLYTPRFVKGRGVQKLGLCPICIEPIKRGGQDKKIWLAMKVSAFKCYHMQYFHGISASSGMPFSPPVAFRTIPRKNAPKTERSQLQQGKCHKCSKWIAIEGVKDIECKVKEIYWWKHAASCHNRSSISGETGWWEEDNIYKRLLEIEKYSFTDAS